VIDRGQAGLTARTTGSAGLGRCSSLGVVLNCAELVQAIDVATQRLLHTVEGFTDDDISRPSSLPGWSRGHLLTHVAQSADAMRKLLVWARTGRPIPAYASQEARDAAIEAGAGRSASTLLAELTQSAKRFRIEVAALPEPAWQRHVWVLGGAEFPAAQVLDRRLVEIELHHTDLDAGYGPDQWLNAFAQLPLPDPMRTQRENRRRAGTSDPSPSR
jgi:maleylpyruvate isomerase